MPETLGSTGTAEASGTPPAAPGPTVFVPCTQCGGCVFSSSSKLSVEKHLFTCVGFPGTLTETVANEDWPFHSIDAARVRYELDADNWAEYSCSSGVWTWASDGAGLVGGTCVLSTSAPWQIDLCSGFEQYRYVNGEARLIIKARLKLNDCTPLGIA